MSSICVYCLNASGARLSHEHVISRAVLKVAFGKSIQNVSQLPNGKLLIDHESVIKDVCAHCNSRLSQLDEVGQSFVSAIDQHVRSAGVRLSFSKRALSWLLKTHLNHVRCVPDRLTGQHYDISPTIYDRLISEADLSENLLGFYIEGWEGRLGYFWAADGSAKYSIPYFSCHSVLFARQKILVSNFRIKWLDTFVFLPADRDYRRFQQRRGSVVAEMRRDGFELTPVPVWPAPHSISPHHELSFRAVLQTLRMPESDGKEK